MFNQTFAPGTSTYSNGKISKHVSLWTVACRSHSSIRKE